MPFVLIPASGGPSWKPDIVTSFSVSAQDEVTQYPQEGSIARADGIIKTPRRFSLAGAMSQDSVEAYGIQRLDGLRGQILKLSTDRDTYPNLAITGLNMQRQATDGGTQPFSIDMQEILIAQSETTRPTGKGKAGGKKDHGRVSPAAPDTQTEQVSRSWLASIFGD